MSAEKRDEFTLCNSWVPVGERLPEPYGEGGPLYVLAVVSSPGITKREPYVDKVTTSYLRSDVLNGAKLQETPIFTHWMPMPAAPGLTSLSMSTRSGPTHIPPADLNRRVEVEQHLLDAAAGKRPLPDAETCKALAYRLGVPDEFRENVTVRESDTLADAAHRVLAGGESSVKLSDACRDGLAAESLAHEQAEPHIRVIEGCRHTLPRMTEWANNGACPICLTAEVSMLRKAAEHQLHGVGVVKP